MGPVRETSSWMPASKGSTPAKPSKAAASSMLPRGPSISAATPPMRGPAMVPAAATACSSPSARPMCESGVLVATNTLAAGM